MLVTADTSCYNSKPNICHYLYPTEKVFLAAGGLLLLIRDPGPFHFVALSIPVTRKSFCFGPVKRRESSLCSEMAHITISYIHLGRMSPQAPLLGCQGSWAEDAQLDRPLSVTVPHNGVGRGGQRMSWWWTQETLKKALA